MTAGKDRLLRATGEEGTAQTTGVGIGHCSHLPRQVAGRLAGFADADIPGSGHGRQILLDDAVGPDRIRHRLVIHRAEQSGHFVVVPSFKRKSIANKFSFIRFH